MLTKQEIVDYFLAKSGQFIIPDFMATTGMSDPILKALIKNSLKKYSDYIPVIHEELLFLSNNKIFKNPYPRFIISINQNTNNPFKSNLGLISSHKWSYTSNTGRLSFEFPQGTYRVKYAVSHAIDESDLSVPTLSYEDDLFLDLFTADMMISVGRSRRTFILNDLPFQVDYDAMVSEGEDLKAATIEMLRERSQQFLIG
jgi:hypothetical protein